MTLSDLEIVLAIFEHVDFNSDTVCWPLASCKVHIKPLHIVITIIATFSSCNVSKIYNY